MYFIQKISPLLQRTSLCVGLDPNLDFLPKVRLQDRPKMLLEYCQMVVDISAPYVCAFKPQVAYFSAIGMEEVLVKVIDYIHTQYPLLPVILDAKRSDIADTSTAYAQEVFDRYDADAVTLNPYLGLDTIEPFRKYSDRGIFLLCRTSNSGAASVQNLLLQSGEPLYLNIAKQIAKLEDDNIGLVVGATATDAIEKVVALNPHQLLLVPGVGAQGGCVEDLMPYMYLPSGQRRLIVNVSRQILYGKNGDISAQSIEQRCLALYDQLAL